MAIEKVIFTEVSFNRATEIATWLQANATEYFDTIELQENGYEIKCNIGNVTVLDIQTPYGSSYGIYSASLINGVSKLITSGQKKIIGAYKSSKGICLYLDGASSSSETDPTTGEIYLNYGGGRDIYICKSDKGNTSFAFNVFSASSDGAGNVYTADIVANSLFSKWYNSDNASYEVLVSKRPLTVLSPLPLGDGGTFANGLYFTPFSQYKGINNPIILYANGKNYVYDGNFALEE